MGRNRLALTSPRRSNGLEGYRWPPCAAPSPGACGGGAPCDFCRVLVSPEEIEYEVEATLDREFLVLHFHPRCYDTWRASREPPRGETPDAG